MAKKRRRRHRKQRISPSAAIVPVAVVAAAIAILLIAILAIRGCGSERAAIAEPVRPTETSEEASAIHEEETRAQLVEEETAVEETAEPETVIAAEVGSMEDDQDPQSSTNTAGDETIGVPRE